MKGNWIRFPAAVLLGVIGLAVALWMNRECSAPTGPQVLQGANSLNCLDYWLSRYQVLIAGLIVVMALASLKALVARHLVIAGRDRALMVQDLWIRRSREMATARAVAGEAIRLGSEIIQAAPAVAETVTTADVDAHADSANRWLARLTVLEGKAEEAYGGFVGGPAVSDLLRGLAGAVGQVRQDLSREVEVLATTPPPRRYAGSSVVEGKEVFVHAAAEFERFGRSLVEEGEGARARLDQERESLNRLLRALDGRALG